MSVALAQLPERTRLFVENGAPEGERQREAFNAACQLRDAGVTESEAVDLVTTGAARCGLPASEARAAVKSAYKRTPREPITKRHGSNGNKPGKPRVVARYGYTDESGVLLYQVERTDPKGFRQRRPDGKGGWIYDLKGVRRVLYRLPKLGDAQEVFVVEGERDVETVEGLGFTATTNSGGAGKWLADYSQHFSGKAVIICGDNDKPGKEHVEAVAKSLHGTAASIRVVELPKGSKDVSEFVPTLQSRDEAAKQLAGMAESAPEWKPRQPADIKGAILAVLTEKNLTPGQRNDRVASLVVEALTERGVFYFHAQRRDFATAMFFDGETKRLERVQADAFVAWLSEWTGINRSAHVFKFVQSATETAALSGPKTSGIIPESFWASRPGAFYLSNGDGRLVKITGAGVGIADNGTDNVVFGAGSTLTAWTLTEPLNPFASCGLFANANHADDHGAMLLKLWALSFASSPVCKPPLVAAGPIRSGKTRIMRGLAELYGLPSCVEETSDTERSQVAFWVSLDSGGLYALDNVDTRVKWLADAIASASTGAGVFPRKLYTDAERVEMRPRAWLALTTCNATFAADAGLADRLLVVRMNQRDGETSDAALSAEIVANRNAGLSWIARTLATALADSDSVPSGLNKRHPDFAAFAVRLGRAMGQEAEAIAALQAAEADKSRFCLENDSAGAALLALLADGKAFTGTTADLLPILAEYDPDFSEDTTGPRGNRLWSAKRVGKRLAALWLYITEIAEAKRETDRKGFAVFTIKPRSAEYADFKTLKQTNSPARECKGGLSESAKESRQSRQPPRGLLDAADVDAHRAFAEGKTQ